MIIGDRLRQLREAQGLTQGDIEHATGMLRCYISRVEHGHTVPSIGTLERFAAALDVPLYQLFYSRERPPATPHLTPRLSLEELAEEAGPSASEARFLLKVKDLLGRMTDRDRATLLHFAGRLATR